MTRFKAVKTLQVAGQAKKAKAASLRQVCLSKSGSGQTR
jgi:hypothetical protein